MTAVVPETVDDDVVEPRVGGWEAGFLSWRVSLPVIALNAGLQALMVRADPVPAVDLGFLALVLASAVVLLLAVWCVLAAATAAVDGRARGAWRDVGRRPVVLLWALGIGIVAVAASLLATWALPVVLAIGTFLLPPAAAGRPALTGALRTIGHAPIRSLLLVIVALVVAALSVVVALLLGLFITGWLSALLFWVWLGIVGTLLLCRYCVVARRAG